MYLLQRYKFATVESKWQAIWKTTPQVPRKGPPFYCLSMFPYPSGNLHLGHTRVYSISDTLARWETIRGKQVLHPMGWDSFGLPAENAAKERAIEPREWTNHNIESMKQQMTSLGFDFHWDRELSTCNPEYYRWTQELFLVMLRKGLAYQQQGYLNWDPVDKTVLANEQVDASGRSWRSGAMVERRAMNQWYFRITKYADELLTSLKDLDWPDVVKEMQTGWIGKSEGALVKFPLKTKKGETLEAFTTRIDTLYGVSFLMLAAEHPLLQRLSLPAKIKAEIRNITIKAETVRKTGKQAFLLPGVTATHPLTGKDLPILVTDFILQNNGTGCVMGAPAIEERDLKIATDLKLEVISLFTNGKLVNSMEFTGMKSKQAKEAILKHCQSLDIAKTDSSYRLRDWLVSRQRYWGVPIPIIHCPTCGPVPETNLPLMLPPIDQKEKWLHTKCPSCGGDALRESDTLDTFVDSSWYFLRYVDPSNQKEMFSKEQANAWMPVSTYIGGIEHAIMHLLYARFVTKVLRDEGMLTSGEPFKRLLTQGLVMGKTFKHNGRYITELEADVLKMKEVEVTYEKMSKSKGNGVSPVDIVSKNGADILRLCLLFAAPMESQLNWDPALLQTMAKFLREVYLLAEYKPPIVKGDFSDFIRSITKSMESGKFHVAIARCMELRSKLQSEPNHDGLRILLLSMYPLAPHFACEAYQMHTGRDVRNEVWPPALQ